MHLKDWLQLIGIIISGIGWLLVLAAWISQRR